MPMKNPPHVGEVIRSEILDELGLTSHDLAQRLDEEHDKVRSLLNGDLGLSLDVALKIENQFGVSSDMLMNMQRAYDDAQAKS